MGSLRSLHRESKSRMGMPRIHVEFERTGDTYPAYLFTYKGWYCKIAIRSVDLLKQTFSIHLLGARHPLDFQKTNGIMYQADWLFYYSTDPSKMVSGCCEMSYQKASDAFDALKIDIVNGCLSSRGFMKECFNLSKCRNPKDLETLYYQ
jgi:hypothetical protein